jgi:hypothetical protein
MFPRLTTDGKTSAVGRTLEVQLEVSGQLAGQSPPRSISPPTTPPRQLPPSQIPPP